VGVECMGLGSRNAHADHWFLKGRLDDHTSGVEPGSRVIGGDQIRYAGTVRQGLPVREVRDTREQRREPAALDPNTGFRGSLMVKM